MTPKAWTAKSKAAGNGGGWLGKDGGWYSFAMQYKPPVMFRSCQCVHYGFGQSHCNCKHAAPGMAVEARRIKNAR